MRIAVEGVEADIRQTGLALIAKQRTDGGWSQLPSMASDAYGTHGRDVLISAAATNWATMALALAPRQAA